MSNLYIKKRINFQFDAETSCQYIEPTNCPIFLFDYLLMFVKTQIMRIIVHFMFVTKLYEEKVFSKKKVLFVD